MTKTLFRWIVLCLAVTVLAGCGTTGNYAHAVNSWQGAPVHALVHEWGHPNEVKTLAHGNRLYVYREVEHESVPRTYAHTPGFVRMSPQSNTAALSRVPMAMPHRHHEETFWCETSFEVNKTDMIVNSHFVGNNCQSTQDNIKRWAFAH